MSGKRFQWYRGVGFGLQPTQTRSDDERAAARDEWFRKSMTRHEKRVAGARRRGQPLPEMNQKLAAEFARRQRESRSRTTLGRLVAKALPRLAPPTPGRMPDPSEHWGVREMLGEAFREDGNMPHVENPRQPIKLFGKSRDEILAEVIENHSKAVDSGGRRLRRDAQIVYSAVASYPVVMRELTCQRSIEELESFLDPRKPNPETVPDEWATLWRWIHDTGDYEARRTKGRLQAVLLHIDESGGPHLHMISTPQLTADGQYNLDALHPGLAARNEYKRVQSAKGRAPRMTQANKAYSDAMERLLDDYHAKVGVRYEHLRANPDPKKRRKREGGSTYRPKKEVREAIAERDLAREQARAAEQELRRRRQEEQELKELLAKQLKGEDRDRSVFDLWMLWEQDRDALLSEERGKRRAAEQDAKGTRVELAKLRLESDQLRSTLQQVRDEFSAFRARAQAIIRTLLDPRKYLQAARYVLDLSHSPDDGITPAEFKAVQRGAWDRQRLSDQQMVEAESRRMPGAELWQVR